MENYDLLAAGKKSLLGDPGEMSVWGSLNHCS